MLRLRVPVVVAVLSLSGALALAEPPRKPLVSKPEKLDFACVADEDCTAQQLCVAEPEASRTCHLRCAAGCLETQRCTVLDRTETEPPRFVCTGDRDLRCTPCTADAECGLPRDKCVLLTSAEKVCARDCSWDDQCPDGFVCADPAGADGQVKRRQCVPRTGCCNCQLALEKWSPRWGQDPAKARPPLAEPPPPASGPMASSVPAPMWPGGYGVFVPRAPGVSSMTPNAVPMLRPSSAATTSIGSMTPISTPSRPSTATISVPSSPAPSHPVTRPSNF